jgi:DNA modification methylase
MVTVINKQEQQQEEGQKQAIKIADIKIGSRLRKKLTNIDSLAASIAKVGLLHPPVIDENNNKLIAGFRRIKACEKLGWTEIPVRRINIKNAIQGEYDENVERAGFALEDVAAIHEEVQKTRIGHRPAARKGGEEKVSNLDSLTSLSSSSFPTGSSLQVTGKIAGKPHGTVAMMVAIAKAVKANPDRRLELIYDTRSYAELARDVDSDKTRLSKAYSLIKNNEEMIRKRAETEAFARELKPPRKFMPLNADSTNNKDIPEIKDSSVDLILTDPPYAKKDSLALYDSLAKLACAKLKQGGSLVLYYGEEQEPEIHEIFRKYKEQLTWWWALNVKHEGHNKRRIHPKGVWVECKRMMWFVKGKDKLFDNDIHNFIESAKPDKDKHPWAQSSVEAEYIAKNMTISEDSIILDPFMGSGAFVIPAIKLGRWVIGIDIDKQVFDNANSYIKSEVGAKS